MSIFKDNLNNWYVETGTSMGSSMNEAIEAGFKKLRGIELSNAFYNHCKQYFTSNKNVILYQGDSTEILWDVIKDIDERITFFLDAHNSGGTTVHNGKGQCEMIEEIEQISLHPIKNHIIMMDDYSAYIAGNTVLQDLILKINPEYKFTFGTYHSWLPNDVLIAKV